MALSALTTLLGILLPAHSALAAPQAIPHRPPAAVARLAPVGQSPRSQQIDLSISLPLRNREELTNLLQELYNPTSPDYHRFLTPDQFAKRFGPTEQDYEAVVSFAKTHNLTVTARHPNRTLLSVRGAVPDVEQAFHVAMNEYEHPTESRRFHAPDREPSVDLTVPLLTVSGLDNYAMAQPRLKTVRRLAGQRAVPNAGSGPGGGYIGSDFRTAYAPTSSLNGSGQTVGLVQFDGYTASDITYYETLASLPSVTLNNVLIDGATGAPSGFGGEIEVSLDIEMVISMAPSVSKVIVYMAPNGSPWEDVLNRIATDNLAKQIGCSWFESGGLANPATDQIWQQMAAQGQSVYVASGDDDAFPGLIDFPEDSPYVTEVGGTTLTTGSGGAYVSETVWNWGTDVGTGGGISTQYQIPSWQATLSMSANQGSTTLRNTPDVAMTADNVYVRADGYDYNVAGTSCAAPLWAGFTALVNQQAAANSLPTVGFLNPTIYSIGKGTSYSSCFHDITTGNNTSSQSPTKFWAVTGYDLCTGWGTPTGQSLINALAAAAPINLTNQPGNNQVVLGWNSISSASYTLKRSTDGVTFTTIASPSGTTYTDSTAVNGTAYYYIVLAVRSGVTVVSSLPLGPVTPEPTPGTPTVSAVPGTGQIALSWSAVSGATSYNVQISLASGGPYSIRAHVTGTGYTDNLFADGTTYYYRVSAVDVDVAGAYCSPVGPVMPLAVPPTWSSFQAGNNQVVMTWNPVVGAASYNVKRWNGTTYSTIANVTSGHSYTDSTAVNGTAYYYVVSAICYGAETANSSSIGPVTPEVPLAAPTVSATAGIGQIVLSWSGISGATSYHIKRSTASAGPYTTLGSATTTGYTDSTAICGTSYYYVVSTIVVDVEGVNSSPAGPVTPSQPAAPTGLSVQPGYNEIILSWNKVASATSYNVKRSTVSGGTYTTLTPSPSGNLFTDTTAVNGTTYYYVVSATVGGVQSPNSSQVGPVTPGAWINTGSLSYALAGQTATLLPNGTVLVAGGQGADSVSSYNPATGLWTANYSMNDARAFATATLLPNGLVLVAGGQGASGDLASAELYDPATGYWTLTGSMSDARAYATASLLPNGLVLVAGGEGASGNLASAELYNPATGTWTAAGSLNNAREVHTATLLPNGQVLVAGGFGSSGFLASAELYNPATGTWTLTGSLNNARVFATATLLPSGLTLVVGGFDSSFQGLASAELYNPATGTWTSTGSLNNARNYATATLLPNGLVLVGGGASTYDSGGMASMELYNPATGLWALTTSMNYGRYWATATLLPNGSVLVAGGIGSTGYTLASAELYNLVPPSGGGLWSGTGALNVPRINQTTTLLPNGLVLVAGGNDESGGILASAEVYSPASGSWTLDSYSMNHARQYATATLLPNGLVLVAGGDNGSASLASAELYNPATGQWTATGPLNNVREQASATLLPNGMVLVAGGWSTRSQGCLSSAELYNPATGTWTLVDSMHYSRQCHTATLLPNGLVLVAAGNDFQLEQTLASAELYNPATGQWTLTGSLSGFRAGHTATLLPNGLVLVAGGDQYAYGVEFGTTSAPVTSAELYNPATGTWTATASMNTAREGAVATLLPNGLVLVASGDGVTSSELYNPAKGTWTSTGSLYYPAPSATLLPNGRVLAAGGYPYAELYTPVMP